MTKRRVHLMHGFNVRDNGARTVDRLGPYFENAGWEVEQFDYGYSFLLDTLLSNPSRALELKNKVGLSDIVIGHSNAASIIHRAIHMGALFREAVYINPALDKDAMLPDHRAPYGVERVTVFYSPNDRAVGAARLIPGVLWGEMGRTGYVGPHDERYFNINLESILEPPVGHSDAFYRAAHFAPYLTHYLQ